MGIPGENEEASGSPAADRIFQKIIEGLNSRDRRAGLLLYDHFGTLINRMVGKMLGVDQDHDDVVQQVFVNILESIGKVKNPEALKTWIISVTVNTVRRELRVRKYRRIFRFMSRVPERRLSHGRDDSEGALCATRFYEILNGMGTDDRIVFALHCVQDQTFEEIAAACSCSLSTVKRRFARAKRKFLLHARRDPVLASFIGEGIQDDGEK